MSCTGSIKNFRTTQSHVTKGTEDKKTKTDQDSHSLAQRGAATFRTTSPANAHVRIVLRVARLPCMVLLMPSYSAALHAGWCIV